MKASVTFFLYDQLVAASIFSGKKDLGNNNKKTALFCPYLPATVGVDGVFPREIGRFYEALQVPNHSSTTVF